MGEKQSLPSTLLRAGFDTPLTRLLRVIVMVCAAYYKRSEKCVLNLSGEFLGYSIAKVAAACPVAEICGGVFYQKLYH